MAVTGVPIEERLTVKPEQKRVIQREQLSVLVTSKDGVPMPGAKVIFMNQAEDTNKTGRVDLVAPALTGAAARSVPIRAEIHLPNGLVLTGSSMIDVIAGDQWDIRFSPNGDGINDYVVFNQDDLPVKVYQWRRDELVKTVTVGDGRWDGRKDNGVDCEQDLYLVQTKRDRKIVISLYR